MMCHFLVAKGLWNITQGHYNHPASTRTIIAGVEEGAVVDDATGSAATSSTTIGSDDAGCTPE